MPGLPVRGRQWLSRRTALKRTVSRVADAGLSVVRRVGVLDRYPLVVAPYRFSPPGWPPGQRLEVVALADPHAGGAYLDQGRVDQVVDRVLELDPDLVVLLGDYGASHLEGEAHREAVRALGSALRRLQPPLGVLAVLGNHDWWDDPQAQSTGRTPILADTELTSAGITVLENRAVRLQRDDGLAVWVAGLGDQLAHLGPPEVGVDDLEGLTAQLADDAPAILLAHEPDVFPSVPSRYAVTLSGHTHAGQIAILGRTPVVPSRYGSRYVHGHVVEDDRHLVVSAGLGTSVLPLRIGTRPEIVHLVLG